MITYECLKLNDDVLFEFDYHTGTKNLKGLENTTASNLEMGSMNGSISVLKYIARSTPQDDGSAIHYVMNFVENMLYFRSTHDGNRFIGFFGHSESLQEYIIVNDLVKDFERFLKETGKIDMNLDVEATNVMNVLVQRFKFKTIPFEFNKSSGTHALELYYYWSKCFEKVSFLFIDEFDAYYHYNLAERIIRHTINDISVQTVFTSHNSSLIDTGIMRPDCYLLLNDGKLKSLVDSTTRELREAHNLEKMLRNGEFDE